MCRMCWQILELTLLIADYMNAMGHALPGTPQMGTLTRNGSHRSVRSRPTPATTGHNTLSSVGGPAGQQPQPDILKSTPDHQADPSRLHRTDSKKRTHLDSGVA
ncbi:hypothetical protein PR048_028619 [Dryococelus australis]|uniref:Secreted protein n=1 Tax=Dryococelus australis TaxID=614101 RepID=A0ABQ9GEY3_9NEOP|nr:hypothetical protein PR048_028619 [Dryococelus australis]